MAGEEEGGGGTSGPAGVMKAPGQLQASFSEVEICGRSQTSRCGYCKSSGQSQGKSHVTFGMTSKRLHHRDYQALLDRGWRRSGTYLYKPLNSETCCPCYTIRLEAANFRPSKKQRQVMNRLQRYVSGGSSGNPSTSHRQHHHRASEMVVVPVDETAEALLSALREALARLSSEGVLDIKGFDIGGIKVQRQGPGKAKKQAPSLRGAGAAAAAAAGVVVGDYSTAVALQLASYLRKAGGAHGTPQDFAKTLVVRLVLPAHVATASVAANGFINFHLSTAVAAAAPTTVAEAPVVTVEAPRSSAVVVKDDEGGKAVATTPEAWVERRNKEGQGHDLTMMRDVCGATEGKGEEEEEEGDEDSMQVEARTAEIEGWGMPHSFTVETVPAKVTEEVFNLYRKYQVAVHGDSPEEVTRQGFKRFLVSTPLVVVPSSGAATWPGDADKDYKVPYGSYHQLYRVDGRLVAVGVVDILPSCLSSVYCFYDPDFRSFVLGKVTALTEIDWVHKASRFRPDLRYYYLGFYIHSCPKMKYKGQYEPSDLLCPETYQWVPLASCRPILDKTPYARLAQVLQAGSGSTESTGSASSPQQQQEKEARHGGGASSSAKKAKASASAAASSASSASESVGGERRVPPAPASSSSNSNAAVSAGAGNGGHQCSGVEHAESAKQQHEEVMVVVEEEEEEEEDYDEDVDVSDGEYEEGGEGEEEGEGEGAAAVLSVEREEERRQLARSVQTDIGSLEALPDRFQRMLTPILADFAELVGPQLARRLYVTFR